MRLGRLLIAVIAFQLLATQPVFAQRGDIDAMLSELLTLARQGRLVESVSQAREVAKLAQRTLGAEDLRLVEAFNLLALAEFYAGDFAEAERAGRRALAAAEQNAGADGPAARAPLNTLAMILERQDRWEDVERLMERVLAISRQMSPPDDDIIADALNNLGLAHQRRGRSFAARSLFEQALAIQRAGPEPAGYRVAATLNNLALLDLEMGDLDSAAARLEQALQRVASIFGPDHLVLAEFYSNLGTVEDFRQRPRESATAYERALVILRNTVGTEHPSFVTPAANLALLHVEAGRIPEAEELLRTALATGARVHGIDHPKLVPLLRQVLEIRRDRGDHEGALAVARRITATQRRNLPTVAGTRDPRRLRSYDAAQANYLEHVGLLAQAVGHGGPDAPALVAEAFEVAQLALQGAAAQAMAQMAARFATGTGAFAQTLRTRQDLAVRWRESDALVAFARGQHAGRSSELESRMLAERRAIEGDLAILDTRLAELAPDFPALTSPPTLPLESVGASLQQDEALLVYLVGAGSTSLFVLRAEYAALLPLPPRTSSAELGLAVEQLRAQLDLDSGRGIERITPVVSNRQFNLPLAHDLAQRLVAPALPLLEGVRHVLIVPSGPLERFPFGVLVMDAPSLAIRSDSDYRDVAWLAKRYAISILPAIAAAIPTAARPIARMEAFIGFGDPHFGSARGSADLSGLARLPESRKELLAIASALQSGTEAVVLGTAATETRVKSTDLSRYRVIAFATHGLRAGHPPGVLEPSLALTPPAAATPLDDGLLTASEVAEMRLDADLVVLSACNTAAADGVYDMTGLSGLARAFLYAGARSILVSHWSVDSDAAVDLTTRMFRELAHEPSIGTAEALRRAELAMLGDERHPHFAHPAFWSPFIVVGRGHQREAIKR